jgi:hypothetical protein
MALVRKLRPPNAALRGKVAKTMKHALPRIAGSGSGTKKAAGICDAEDAAMVNAVVKAASAHLAR